MPTYQGQVSEEGVISLVEYIKNLNSNYRIQQTTNTTEMLPEGEGSPKGAALPPASQGSKAQGPNAQGMVKQ